MSNLKKRIKQGATEKSKMKLIPTQQQKSTLVVEPVLNYLSLAGELRKNDVKSNELSSSSNISVCSEMSRPSAIELQLTNMVCADPQSALHSMLKVEIILLSEDRVVLQNHIDYFVMQLVNQLVVLGRSNINSKSINCYHKIFTLFMELYYFPELKDELKEGVLRRAFDQLVIVSCNEELELFFKPLDCLLCTMLELSNFTETICALLKSLYDTVANTSTPSQFQDGIIKCIWKVVTLLPHYCDVEKLVYKRIFSDIHAFLRDYPTHWWQNQPSDTPLRTVNTLLRMMVNLKPHDSNTYVKMIENVTSESEILVSCNKLTKWVEANNKICDELETESNGKSHRISRSLRNELSEIKAKIQSENSKEGLEMLYDFKQQHPEVDIKLFFAKSTKFWQDFIQRGLQCIEMEQRYKQEEKLSDFESEVDLQMASNRQEDVAKAQEEFKNAIEVQQLLERLHSLQDKAGCFPRAVVKIE